MIKTHRQLADGRQILYFDRAPVERTAVDQRNLSATNPGSELRFDALLGEWVTIAAHRQTRTFLPSSQQCPLCPSRAGRHTEIPEPDYEVAVFENRFAALPAAAAGSGPRGRCEVVCFTSAHDTAFAQLPPERVRLVVDVWADRTAELSALPDVAQVFCFENFGPEIGVTLTHPHGQIYAYPFVPPRTQLVERAAAAYDGELFGDFLAAERHAGTRVVAANSEWTAFVPPAARWPYEVMLFPHRRVPDIPDLDDAQRDAFAELYLDVLQRFASRFATPMPYVAAWQQPPVGTAVPWWLHLQLFSIRRTADKLKYLAGSESGMGAFISDTTPEHVAAELRELR